jgi:hypothetical protein
MKKTISIILAIIVVSALAFGLVACGDKSPQVYEKSMTAQEAENFLFGNDGAINFSSKVFNVKAVYSTVDEGEISAGESILILDETNGVNFATVYDNVSTKDDDGEIENRTNYIFIKWTEKNDAMKNDGVVHAYSTNGGVPQYSLMKSGYEGIHNNVVKNSGIHGGRNILENHIHNANDDIYDTIEYSAKAIYSDSAMTDMSRVEIVLTYHYEDDGQRINGTATIVLERKTVTIYNGSEVDGFVFTSMVIEESDGQKMTINYTYGVDSIDLPDINNLEATWPDAYHVA